MIHGYSRPLLKGPVPSAGSSLQLLPQMRQPGCAREDQRGAALGFVAVGFRV